ncbi:apoptotic chromatin condensation inducer in the nucleus-like protein isoform X1 [Tanacetum coccineum]
MVTEGNSFSQSGGRRNMSRKSMKKSKDGESGGTSGESYRQDGYSEYQDGFAAPHTLSSGAYIHQGTKMTHGVLPQLRLCFWHEYLGLHGEEDEYLYKRAAIKEMMCDTGEICGGVDDNILEHGVYDLSRMRKSTSTRYKVHQIRWVGCKKHDLVLMAVRFTFEQMSSSPYVVLENRSLDQWKVTDLKEQLKRRNLTTKGLKDDLVKRLDQAVRAEIRQDNHHNGVNQTTNIDDGNTESLEDNVTTEDKHVDVAQSINILFNKNDTEDVGSPDKLNLDPTSGDDSMEEDVLETKQIDSNFTSQHIGDINEKTQVPPPFKEGEPLDVMAEDTPAANNDQSAKDTSDSAAVSTKRKLNEQEAVTNSEVVKRQRRWNSQGLNIPEQQNTRPSVSTTPKGGFQASIKHSFSRYNSSVSEEEPKERVVPPSLKDPTNSLRIDRFLRPFTLKAVQELLEKTGTVVSFWMDHIKTHCYVTEEVVSLCGWFIWSEESETEDWFLPIPDFVATDDIPET